jgi:site-specific DNA recombinase
VKQLRCAIYARFSSDRQSPTSISDQIRKCRDYAARHGWLVVDEDIYADEGISGTSTERAGLQRLLLAVDSPVRAFDCILIDDTSRLTRKLADALNLYERLTFAGVRLVAVSQGVDSESSQAELLIGVHGLIDAVYWRELGQKTHRGMQGLALRGFHTGGRCFGYKSVKSDDGNTRLEVNPPEAQIIERIYRLYGEHGYSIKRIAHALNSEGVLAPQPQKGRFSRSWCVSSVRHILLNRKYAGCAVWNTRRKIRVPGTGKRVFRPRPESEWVTIDTPQLRIIGDDLSAAVQRRFATVRKLWGREGSPGLASGQQRQVYLFSGLLQCGQCGGSIALVMGRRRNGAERYGCSLHNQRGDAVCSNALTIRRDDLEDRLLRGLSESVLRPEAIDYAVDRISQELQQRFESFDSELERLRQRKQQIHSEIARLVQAIAEGQPSQSLMAAIGDRERELREITDKLLEPRPGSLRGTLDELRKFATERLANLRKLISHPESVHQARAVMAEQFGKLTLTPVRENGALSYAARGKVDFFGEQAMIRVGGAGGQNRTGYARLFRAALYQ